MIDLDKLSKGLKDRLAKETPQSIDKFFNDVDTKKTIHLNIRKITNLEKHNIKKSGGKKTRRDRG